MKTWFDSLSEFFVHYGFAERVENNSTVGEICFLKGQTDRIVNLDESGLSLDNTDSKTGGRPAMGFFDPYLQESASTETHKSSYRLTGMFGCTASGRAIPLHLVLPTDATSDENMEIPFRMFKDFKRIAFDLRVAPDDYGTANEEVALDECNTYGISMCMNKKGSMTKEELQKYFLHSFAKLYPDCRDFPGHRVAVLIDGGPGRTNAEMLAQLRNLGILLFPSGLPNTTHVLQVMDQLFGEFKSIYRKNLDLLWHYRLQLSSENKEYQKITRFDIGQLIFGSQLPDGTELQDAFDKAFSAERIRSKWKEVGIVPFTRNSLKSKHVRHELVMTSNGEVDDSADPMSSHLMALHNLNSTCCAILTSFGADGNLLYKEPKPKNSAKQKAKLTVPNSRERQDAIANSTTQGGLFLRTGGATANADDVFIAMERNDLNEKMKRIDTEKADKLKNMDREGKAQAILSRVEGDESRLKSSDLKDLIAWKTGKPCPSSISTVESRRAKWNSIKDSECQWQPWTPKDEEERAKLCSLIDSLPIEATL